MRQGEKLGQMAPHSGYMANVAAGLRIRADRHRSTALTLCLLAAQLPPAIAQAPGQTAPSPAPIEERAPSRADHATGTKARHPLDPLEPDEIRTAVATIKGERRLSESVRFVTVTLNEPDKARVLHDGAGNPAPREAFMVLLDNATGTGYEAVVDLLKKKTVRFEALAAGVQPSITLDEFVEVEQVARQSPAFQEALKKRGITDPSL